MKTGVALLVLLLTPAVASAQTAASKAAMIVTAFEDAKFEPVNPKLPDGPQMAVLWGDPAQGPSTMLLKLKKGSVPLHVHTADYHLVVLEGTMKHWAGTETEDEAKPLGPGSSWFQPGDQVHGDSCLTAECLMYVSWKGKRDGRLASSARP